MTGFEAIRDAAAEGVKAVGCHPVRSEDAAARTSSSRRALFDEIGAADIFLLLLGSRYGDVAESGRSATEDEYQEAVRTSRPIMVLVQDCDMEPRQRTFLESVRGSWGEGVFYGSFHDANDVDLKIAGAIAKHQSGILEDGPTAIEHALELVQADERNRTNNLAARIVYVPLRRTSLLEAIDVDDASLSNRISSLLREADLVPHTMGISHTVVAGALEFAATSDGSWDRPRTMLMMDGAVVIETPIADERAQGLSSVDPHRLKSALIRAGRFARSAWDEVDSRHEVGNVAVAVGILNAQYSGFGEVSGGSMHIGSGLHAVEVAPNPPIVSPRGDLDSAQLADRVVAAVRRVFADAGAVQ